MKDAKDATVERLASMFVQGKIVCGETDTKPGCIVGSVAVAMVGSECYPCAGCGEPVHLSDGKRMHARYPDIPIICLDCCLSGRME